MSIRILLIPALALAILAVAACGDDSASNPTPSPTPTPSPVVTGWQITGQFSGSAPLGAVSCAAAPGYYQVALNGKLNDEPVVLLLNSFEAGTFDLAQPSTRLTVFVQIGDTQTAGASGAWSQNAGQPAAVGKVTIADDGTGSMTGVIVSPAPTQAGLAASTLSLTGEWTCPAVVPFDTATPAAS